MKKTVKLTAILVLFIVPFMTFVGCGGDDDTPQEKIIETIKLSQNKDVIMEVGSTKEVTILEGNGEYDVTTNKPNIAVAGISNNKIIITAKSEGDATISITDRKGKTTTLNVKVTPKAVELRLSVTEKILMEIGTTRIVSITQGNGEYSAKSGNTSIATAEIVNEKITITAKAEGETIITISDKKGKTATLNVKVTPKAVELKLNVTEKILMAIGTTRIVSITQGNGEYSAKSGNTSIATAEILNEKITITAKAEGETIITISDKKGKTTTLNVKVSPKTVELKLDKTNTIYIEKGELGIVNITQGNGGYIVKSSNTNVATASVEGNKITITAKNEGTTTIKVEDQKGKEVSLNVEVSNTPADYNTYIELTTDRDIGDNISLGINSEEHNVWIDLNNNGVKDSGEDKITYEYSKTDYILGSKTIRIYGKLTYFYCEQNNITSLDISNNPYLRECYCSRNILENLKVLGANNIEYLACSDNQLTSIDVSELTNLKELVCGYNKLTVVNMKNNLNLGRFFCNKNNITNLDILSEAENLREIECGFNEYLIKINISKNKKLTRLFCFKNKNLASLDVSNNKYLTELNCLRNNSLSCIKVSQKQLDNIPSNWKKDDTATYSTECN